MRDARKTALRAYMKIVRAGIDAVQRAKAAERLVGFARHLPIYPSATVSGYSPIRDELDPRPLMAALAAGGARLCLPLVQGRDKPLTFRAWAPEDAMETVAWGIQEPRADQPTRLPDIMLVPLLAIDRDGNRLGYGAGHYDRTIVDVRRSKPVVTIGLAFDAQIVDAVPHMPYDVALDWILTPSGLIRCQGAA